MIQLHFSAFSDSTIIQKNNVFDNVVVKLRLLKLINNFQYLETVTSLVFGEARRALAAQGQIDKTVTKVIKR